MFEQVKAVIDEEIKPALNAHGGDVELVEVTDEGVVRVKLQGACAGCPGAQMTISAVVEKVLKEKFPQVTQVEAIS